MNSKAIFTNNCAGLQVIYCMIYRKGTEMHGGKSMRKSLAVPATVKVRAPPSIVRC